MISSKVLPFIVLALAAGFMGIDTFTEYTISDEMISLAAMILAPIGMGGLINKGWDTYKAIKTKPQ